MKEFEYTHPTPAHFSANINGLATDLALFQGEVYHLPEDDATVQSLLNQGFLKPIAKPSKK